MAKYRDNDKVTLVTTDVLTPYAKGEVFTIDGKTANALLDPNRRDPDNKQVAVKVQVYDPKNDQHVKTLEAQRGKPVDADLEPVPADQRRAQELLAEASRLATEEVAKV